MIQKYYITKEYFDKKVKNFVTKDYLDKKLEKFVTKDYLDETINKKFDEKFNLQEKRIKQHMTDLTSGFKEMVKGVCDQVTSLNEKMDRNSEENKGKFISLDNRVTKLEVKVGK